MKSFSIFTMVIEGPVAAGLAADFQEAHISSRNERFDPPGFRASIRYCLGG